MTSEIPLRRLYPRSILKPTRWAVYWLRLEHWRPEWGWVTDSETNNRVGVSFAAFTYGLMFYWRNPGRRVK